MADDKKIYNQNISTEYEEDVEKGGFWSQVGDFFSAAGNMFGNWITGDKQGSINKAQEAQTQIDTLTDSYFNNGDLTDSEKYNIASQIANLEKTRDDALSGKDKGGDERYDWLWRQISPIGQYDIYKSINPNGSYNDFLATNKGSTSNADTLKKSMEFREDSQIKTFRQQMEEDLRLGKTTEEDIKSGKYLSDLAMKQKRGSGFNGYLNDFIQDVANNSTPYDFSLATDDGVQYFFKDDQQMVISSIITSDDIQKAIQNNYNVVKKIEGRLNSDDAGEVEMAQNPRVQGIYKDAIRNLNNLKDEVRYIYENFGNTDGNMADIEYLYMKDKGRKMFSQADNSVRLSKLEGLNREQSYTSEDWATFVSNYLNVYSDKNLEHDYPNTREHVKGTLFSPVKSIFHDIGFVGVEIRDSFGKFSDYAALGSNTLYYALGSFSWDDIDWGAAYDVTKAQQYGMGSLRSIRDELTNENRGWNKIYNTALAVADAGPTISKEAYTFALTELLMDSMGVVSTADMIKSTAEGSTKYANVARWNLALAEKGQDINFATQGILKAKLLEFAGRGIVQNYILSAEATGNFSEGYTDLDFGLDLAFGMIDVFVLGHGLTIGKGKITTEARKNIMRTAIKDTLMITPEQWEILMATAEGRRLVDEVAGEMRASAVKSIDDLASAKGVTRDEIIAEITNAIKKSKNPEAAKVFIKQQDRILEQVQKNVEQSLAMAVYAKDFGKSVPQSILNKLRTITFNDINGEKVTRAYRDPQQPLTKDEFVTLMEAVDTPYIKKLWDKYQKILTGRGDTRAVSIENFQEQFRELDKIKPKTQEQRIELDNKKRELEKSYKQYLYSIMLDDPVRFRRREYEKYGRPHGYEYDDVEYTYLSLGNTREEVENALWKRLEEYGKEIESYEKRGGIREEAQYVTGLTTESIRLSNEITGKPNLVGLSYQEACEINPSLKINGESFFNQVMFADYLETYQKNMILWSTPEEGKILKDSGFVTFEVKPGGIQAFGSLFEQEHFIGKVGSQGKVLIEGEGVVEGDYVVRRTAAGNVFVAIKDENGITYKLNVREGVLKMDGHTAKVVPEEKGIVKIGDNTNKMVDGGQFNVTFIIDEKNRFSGIFDLYGYKGNKLEGKLEKYTRRHPKEMGHYSTMQVVENALRKDLDNPIYGTSKRNWYQSDSAKQTFKNSGYLSSAQMTSGYIDIVQKFDIPFSYFVELKKMINKGIITEREGAALILLASGSGVGENADYFIVNAGAKIKGQLQTFMFHQCGVVMLPFGGVKSGGFKPYFYERVTGTQGLYNIYSTDSSQRHIGRLGINPETGDIIYESASGNHYKLDQLRIDKNIGEDIDSIKYAYRKERYERKREKAFDKFVEKSKQDSFNFYGVQEGKDIKDITKNKYQIITKGDRRSLYTSYNSDIKVKKKNRKQIEDIYLFKNAMINQKSIGVSLFYSWFQYSVLTRFMSDNFGMFKNTKDITDFFLGIKNKGLIKDKNIINFDGDHMRILIDTEGMGFKLNYSIQGLKDGRKRSSLIFLIDDANTGGRVLSIDNIGLFDVKEINGDTYLRVGLDTDGDIDYYLKLDDSLKKQDIWNVNTLSLSKEDYLRYMENPGLVGEAIGKSVDDFVALNIFNFPPEVIRIVGSGGSTSDVYAYMKQTIQSDSLMQEIARLKGIDINAENASIPDLLTIYQEYSDVTDAVRYVSDLGYKVSEEDMIKYYKYLYGENTFGNSGVIKVIDSVFGLGNFREQIVDGNIKERLINLVSLDKGLKLSGTSYSYFQKRIMDIRLTEFMEEFNKGYFREGLDLSDPKDYKKYVNKVKRAYKYATEIVSPEDIRSALYSTKRKSKLIQNGASTQGVYNMVNKIDTFGSILSDVKKGLIDDKLTSESFKDLPEDGVNRWKEISYNGNTHRSLEDMADIIDEWLQSGISRDEIVKRLQYGILLGNSNEVAQRTINNLERNILYSSSEYRGFLESSRFKAGDTSKILSYETSELGKQLDELIATIKKDAVGLTDDDVRELESLKNEAIKLNEQGGDLTEVSENFVNKRNELSNRSNEQIYEQVKEINLSRDETKKEIVETFESERKVKEEPTVDVKEEKISEENIVKEEEQQIEENLPEEVIIKDLDERKEKKITWNKAEGTITNDIIGYEQDSSHQLTISEFFAGHQHGGKGFWKLRDRLNTFPVGNSFMNQTERETYRAAWITFLNKNKDNLAEFVKSEEGMEMMLYSMLYRIPLPEEFIDTFKKVFGISNNDLSKTGQEVTSEGNVMSFKKRDYDYTFNYMKDVYEKYFGVKIDIVENNGDNVLKINYKKSGMMGEASNSMFNQMRIFRDDYVENGFGGLKTGDYTTKKTKTGKIRYEVPNYELQTYDVRRIANDNGDFIKDYNKYLSNARKDGAYYNKTIYSGPMSIYEFWTLNKLAGTNDEVKKYVKNLLKNSGRGRYINIGYGMSVAGVAPKWRNQFYNLLTNEENISEFRSILKPDAQISDEFLLSPYYKGKISEGLIENEILMISPEAFKKSSMNEKMLNQGKIIIVGGDVNDITKYLDGKSDLYEYNIKYADEVEVTPIKGMDDKTKRAAENVNDKTIEDSLKTTCK